MHCSAGKREKSPEVWQRRRQRKNARKTRINFIVKIVFNLSHWHLNTCMCVCECECVSVYKVMKVQRGRRKREKGRSGRAEEQKAKEILVDGRGKSIYSKKLVIVVVVVVVVTTLHG